MKNKKAKSSKRILITVIAIILVLSVCCFGFVAYKINIFLGGSSISEKNESSRVIKQMKDYLQNKYGNNMRLYSVKDFNLVEHGSCWSGCNDYDVMCASVGSETFTVKRYKTDDGYSIQDNYLGYLFGYEVESMVQIVAKDYFEDFEVYSYFGFSEFLDDLPDDLKYSDLIKYKDNLSEGVDYTVVVNSVGIDVGNFNTIAKNFVSDSRLVDLGIESTFEVDLMTNEQYDDININSRDNASYISYDEKIADYTETINERMMKK